MYLPTTRAEMIALGWDALDVILVSGDSYIDSPFIGAAVIGRVLQAAGYRVGIIAQPSTASTEDITRLGEPRLFWGVTAGAVDSMVANYTALKKKRRSDDYTPGGENNRRPDRASIVYSNLIRRAYKNTRPIVLGGIEASLRRIAHYDFWDDRVRGSLLLDAKADYLVYGMGEATVLALAAALAQGGDARQVAGLCYLAREPREGYLVLPAFPQVAEDKAAFTEMFHLFYANTDPVTAKGVCQQHSARWVIQNPPAPLPTQAELDAIYALDYERDLHPYYAAQGPVRALETIRFSLTTHRGCYGECNYCAIAVHEGRTVRWRSPDSIVAEAEKLTRHPKFKGIIQDAGGPTANMYGFECAKKLRAGACSDKRCVYPQICRALKPTHAPQLTLLRRLRAVRGVRKVFVASGVRYDLLLCDKAHGEEYLRELVNHHVSGQMKVAPEHTEGHVLDKMGKPGVESLLAFKALYDRLNREAGKEQYLTYYLIAAHPGCSEEDMLRVRDFAARSLHIHPEQVQVFTPTPSTYSSLMYYTECDPFTGQPLFVEKNLAGKERQKALVAGQPTTPPRRTPRKPRP